MPLSEPRPRPRPRPRPVALTVAGTDSGGGAGVAADLKVFQAHGVWGTCAVTAVTAQNTEGVHAVSVIPADMVVAQIDAVVGDIGVDAAKTGMLATAELVSAVAAALRRAGVAALVVDPVLVSKHGTSLLADESVTAVRDELLPLAAVVTPNLAEAARLVGFPVDDRAAMEAAAHELVRLGAGAALVKGGHLGGDGSPDCLVLAGDPGVLWLEAERIPGRNTHGTGCVLSAALCAGLARGTPVPDAARAATAFIRRAIAGGLGLGAGIGPVDPGGPPPPNWTRG
ncbi:MAG: bifunctional hydroxymethylpyrimidine kinase/phosphomethylpyrimidine kinase [Acidimicrobiales bacterium]